MKQRAWVIILKKFIKLFNKVGGFEVLKQYWRGHVLLFALIQTILLGFSKKSLEIVRLSVSNKLLSKLRRKYRRVIADHQANYIHPSRTHSNKVWVCWLQGIDNAPELVQRCYASLQDNLADRQIILLTEKNYSDYVKFPDHIQRKIDSGVISRTHMSDLLRLELLLNHGGTWIDATVFCSGDNIPSYMLDSELFLFQNLKPGLDGHSTAISSWFMTACTGNPVLALTRELLYAYWKKKNAMVDYFLIHDFFQLAIESYPDEWAKVVPFSNSIPHILLLRLFDTYDAKVWEYVKAQTPFHKLTYKFAEEQAQLDNTYYSRLLARRK